jgi:hypothetical protein
VRARRLIVCLIAGLLFPILPLCAQQPEWNSLIADANKAYAERRYPEAEQLFSVALKQAETFDPGESQAARNSRKVRRTEIRHS